MFTTTNSFTVDTRQPEAYITKNRNRLKQIGSTVYLKDEDEFELELFNPKTISVLVKIKINGNYISSRGLVINPGQRIYLDRHIDEARKFLFSTYEIDGGDTQVLEAIQNNGDVVIEFYDQTIVNSFSQPYYWYNNTTGNNSGTVTFTNGSSNNLCTYSSGTLGMGTTAPSAGLDIQAKSIETGRIEKGGNSDTKFRDANMDFNYFVSTTVTWKILPISQKPLEVGEIRNYCGECGYRIRKSNWSFCPSCGGKL